MQFLLIAYDGTDDDAPARRTAARPAHLELGDKMLAAGNMKYGAAILDDDGDMIGSMLVLDFPTRTALDEWLETEPYVIGGVWEQIQVQPCKVGPSFINLK